MDERNENPKEINDSLYDAVERDAENAGERRPAGRGKTET
jgi:hypothetical protein